MKTSTSARSPLSPTLWPPDAFVWWQSLAFGVALAIVTVVASVFVLGLLLTLNVATLAELRKPATLTWPLFVSQMASYVASFVVIATLLPALAKRSLRRLGLRLPTASDVVWGIAGAIAMFAVAELVGAIQQTVFHLKTDEVQVQWLRAARGPMIAAFAFLACIAAPVFEELTFRGYVFNALLRYLPAWLAMVVTSALFGIAHWQPGNAGAIVPLIGAGIVLVLVYYRTGSLTASIVTHGLFNAFAVIGVIVLHQT